MYSAHSTESAKPYFTVMATFVSLQDTLVEFRLRTLLYGNEDPRTGLFRIYLDNAKRLPSTHYADLIFGMIKLLVEVIEKCEQLALFMAQCRDDWKWMDYFLHEYEGGNYSHYSAPEPDAAEVKQRYAALLARMKCTLDASDSKIIDKTVAAFLPPPPVYAPPPYSGSDGVVSSSTVPASAISPGGSITTTASSSSSSSSATALGGGANGTTNHNSLVVLPDHEGSNDSIYANRSTPYIPPNKRSKRPALPPPPPAYMHSNSTGAISDQSGATAAPAPSPRNSEAGANNEGVVVSEGGGAGGPGVSEGNAAGIEGGVGEGGEQIWACPQCTYHNTMDTTICAVCLYEKR